MSATRDVAAVNAVLDAHAEILPQLVALTSGLESLDVAQPNDADLALVAAQVRSLRAALARHFADEENNGLHQRLVQLVPDAAGTVGKLHYEHHQVLAGLDTALADAERCTPAQAEKVRRGVTDVLETLYAHEAIEDQLMTRAFGDGAPGRYASFVL